MKGYKSLFTIFICILFILPLSSSAYKTSFQKNNFSNQYQGFYAEDITFDDACYKGSDIFHILEWWYFDAVFDNGYSIEYHMDLFSKAKIGLAVSMLNIYKDGNLVSHSEKIDTYKEFNGYKYRPFLWLSGQQILRGEKDEFNNWNFQLSITMNDGYVDLNFDSSTKGWKSKILNMWWWGVIQPKAEVTGKITLLNKTIPVEGTGYQEHGWDGNLPSVVGWFWGKLSGETLNVVWTNVIKYPWKQYLMLVINEDQGDYVNIPVKDIIFKKSGYKIIDGTMIPTTFYFYVDTEEIKIDVILRPINIEHQRSFGPFNYWRYHCRATGTLSYDSVTENIDSIEIMDLTKFLMI